ncbi:MAG: VOC family protein [Oceanospirillaceae bacterium]|nr:VOC family protein [Oceanospirillaceae bacterium]
MVKLDHLVLTVREIDRTVSFYEGCLGMEKVVFGDNRVALNFGGGKINLHQAGKEFEPKALRPTPGSADLCFVTEEPLAEVDLRLREQGIDIIEGPVRRTGSVGPILSVYIRDPDLNLIEIANNIVER